MSFYINTHDYLQNLTKWSRVSCEYKYYLKLPRKFCFQKDGVEILSPISPANYI